MILNTLSNNAVNTTAAPLTIGQASVARDPIDQNSSFRPIDEIESPERASVRVGADASEESAEEGTAEARAQQSEEQRLREERIEREQLERDQREITDLSARDREVRAHEQAHAAVGGQYASAPTYDFKRGPDGINYAVGGEVQISTSKEATPEQTVRKAQIVRRAALAPADPSPQDRRVAALATRMEADARAEISQNQRIEAQEASEKRKEELEEDSTLRTPSQSVTSAEGSTLATERQTFTRNDDRDLSSRPVITNVSLRLSQSIANTAQNPLQPGSILSQVV